MSGLSFRVGDRVESTYGAEHVGVVVEVKTFSTGRPWYLVKRDSDGFVWSGWPGTMLPAGSHN